MRTQLRVIATCIGISAIQAAIPEECVDTFALPKPLFVFSEPADMYRFEIYPLVKVVGDSWARDVRNKQDPRPHNREELSLVRARLEDLQTRFPQWRQDLVSYRLGFITAIQEGRTPPKPEPTTPNQ